MTGDKHENHLHLNMIPDPLCDLCGLCGKNLVTLNQLFCRFLIGAIYEFSQAVCPVEGVIKAESQLRHSP